MINFAHKFHFFLAAIKQLAGQTLWYGVSNVGARMLNFLLTPLLTYLLADNQGMVDYGGMNVLYAWIAAANIIFTYGLETAFFRFSSQEGANRDDIFQTSFGSLIISTFFLTLGLYLFRNPIQTFLDINGHASYITWCALLIALDTLSAIPFARLRQENRPRRYAFVKLAGILINIVCIVFFLVYLPKWLQAHPGSSLAGWYGSNTRLGFILLANLLQNLFVFLVLYPEWKSFRFRINSGLWKKMVNYSAPMVIIGLAGMINEVMDREFLDKLLPFDNDANKKIIAVYSANYKLAIFITLFIQAFKMAAEPFFFSQAKEKHAPSMYARVMKWFVITLAIAFLFTALYLDIWKVVIIRGDGFRRGTGVVPVLLLANICLGIYYNLSVWYKLTDRMRMGIYITLVGAAITIVGNYGFIPKWGMYASAWSTLVCYFTMMVLAYFLGQRYYPVPYPVKKIIAYLVVMLVLFFLKVGLDALTAGLADGLRFTLRVCGASILMGLFLLLVLKAERKELKGMPFVGRFIR